MNINTNVYIFGVKYAFDSFWAFFIATREWIHTLPPIYQILLLVGLIAMTVGIFSLTFYIVKAVFQLVFEIIKLLVKFIRSLFVPRKHHRPYHYKYDHPKKMSKPSRRYARPPTPPTRPTPQTRLTPTQSPKATRVMTQTSSRNDVIRFPQLLHCPNCGGTFTNEMMKILSESESVYCEFCGNKLEYELQ